MSQGDRVDWSVIDFSKCADANEPDQSADQASSNSHQADSMNTPTNSVYPSPSNQRGVDLRSPSAYRNLPARAPTNDVATVLPRDGNHTTGTFGHSTRPANPATFSRNYHNNIHSGAGDALPNVNIPRARSDVGPGPGPIRPSLVRPDLARPSPARLSPARPDPIRSGPSYPPNYGVAPPNSSSAGYMSHGHAANYNQAGIAGSDRPYAPALLSAYRVQNQPRAPLSFAGPINEASPSGGHVTTPAAFGVHRPAAFPVYDANYLPTTSASRVTTTSSAPNNFSAANNAPPLNPPTQDRPNHHRSAVNPAVTNPSVGLDVGVSGATGSFVPGAHNPPARRPTGAPGFPRPSHSSAVTYQPGMPSQPNHPGIPGFANATAPAVAPGGAPSTASTAVAAPSMAPAVVTMAPAAATMAPAPAAPTVITPAAMAAAVAAAVAAATAPTTSTATTAVATVGTTAPAAVAVPGVPGHQASPSLEEVRAAGRNPTKELQSTKEGLRLKFFCEICQDWKDARKVKRHLSTHVRECTLCSHVFADYKELARHIEADHIEANLKKAEADRIGSEDRCCPWKKCTSTTNWLELENGKPRHGKDYEYHLATHCLGGEGLEEKPRKKL
ncbi:hypothetical protein F5Y04DRAFT_288136 [Hypomontagnella monticulosa]|nr:hypothetical protein F5Y04DRAFT_288136 [Hypomontagnella monticulosa]